MRIQKLNAEQMNKAENHEYTLLDEIARDSMVTQAGLSRRLGIAVGSVNWYIKRLIQRGWVKISHLDRTRLRYDLTSEGMKILTQRALSYAKDSLKVYGNFRDKSRALVAELGRRGIKRVHLEGNDELMDILRLTCIEAGLDVSASPAETTVKWGGKEYRIMTGKPRKK